MLNNNDSPSIAHAILCGAATQLVHGTLCSEPRLSLQCAGPRRRLLCINCEQFAQLPVAEDYDSAWQQIGQQGIIEKIHSLPSPQDLTTGVCEHGIAMTVDCTQCAVESSKMIFLPGGPAALNGRMEPPQLQS